MLIMPFYQFNPTRSGLIAICKLLPANSGVLHSARLLLIKSIKAANTRLQIKFLENCKKDQRLPKQLLMMNIPYETPNVRRRGDNNDILNYQHLALSDIDTKTFSTCLKNHTQFQKEPQIIKSFY